MKRKSFMLAFCGLLFVGTASIRGERNKITATSSLISDATFGSTNERGEPSDSLNNNQLKSQEFRMITNPFRII